MALTSKQKAFCRSVACGSDYITAYKSSYDWNGSDNGAYTEAIRLANREDIQAEIKALQRPLEIAAQKDALTEREKKRTWLWNMIENATNDADKLRAMDILNKMDSEYININRNIEDRPAEITQLDNDTLKKLSEAI